MRRHRSWHDFTDRCRVLEILVHSRPRRHSHTSCLVLLWLHSPREYRRDGCPPTSRWYLHRHSDTERPSLAAMSFQATCETAPATRICSSSDDQSMGDFV